MKQLGEKLQGGAFRTGLTSTDLVREAWSSVIQDRARSVMTMTGTLLGALAFVATLGITGTISQQVSTSFDVRRATEVVVSSEVNPEEEDPDLADFLAVENVERLAALSGVEHAGTLVFYAPGEMTRGILKEEASVQIPIIGASASALEVVDPQMVTGRSFDSGHETRADSVVMLSASAAQQLRIAMPGSALFIQDRPFTIVGIYDDVERQPDLLGGVLIPSTAIHALELGVQARTVVVETAPGAAQQIGSQAALALQPNAPDDLDVNAPPDPQTLRQEVETNVTQMSLLAGLVALIAGSVSIGNSATASMIQRIPEIGLRRALGAKRSDIFLQLLGETTFLGMLGGITGAGLGIIATVTVSLARGWVPLIDPLVILAAIAATTSAGTLAGFWPALRATKISPTEALAR